MTDEKTGPGHPPRHSQFQKGRSGNPRGRPRDVPNRKTIDKSFWAVFFDREMTINGRNGPKKVNSYEALLTIWLQNALNGDATAIEKITDRVERRASSTSPEPKPEGPEDDEAILRRYLGRGVDLPPDDPTDADGRDGETPDDDGVEGDDDD